MTQFGISQIIFYPKLKLYHFFKTCLKICWCLCVSLALQAPRAGLQLLQVPVQGYQNLGMTFACPSKSFPDFPWEQVPFPRIQTLSKWLTPSGGCDFMFSRVGEDVIVPYHLTFNISAKNHQLLISFLDNINHLKRVLTALWLLPIFSLGWIS